MKNIQNSIKVCTFNSLKDKLPRKCKWYIKSEEYNNCFWQFVADKSSDDGAMAELSQSDLAKLFEWSTTNSPNKLRDAMNQLVEQLKKENKLDLFKNLAD